MNEARDDGVLAGQPGEEPALGPATSTGGSAARGAQNGSFRPSSEGSWGIRGRAHGAACVPTSKSIAQRFVVAAALAHGRTRLAGLPDGEDVGAALAWARDLGLISREHGPAAVTLTGCPPGPSRGLAGASSGLWRVGESGTLARLLIGAAGLASFVGRSVRIEAAGSLVRRTPGPLLDALRAAGAGIVELGTPWPLEVRAVGPPSEVVLEAPRSSQEVSSLLLALAAWPDQGALRVRGALPSAPYIDLTRWALERFGVVTEAHRLGAEEVLFLVNGPLRPPEEPLTVEPDASAAAVALAAGCLSGGRVVIPGLGRETPQGDIRILEHLRAFGCRAGFDPDGAWAEGAPLGGARLDLSGEPDLAPVLTALAVAAARERGAASELGGLGTLEGKESPRLTVLAGFVEALGCRAEVRGDLLRIAPADGAHAGPLAPAPGADLVLDGEGDHRMVFAGVLLGLVEPRVRVRGFEAAAKSWPRLLQDLEALGLEWIPGPTQHSH